MKNKYREITYIVLSTILFLFIIEKLFNIRKSYKILLDSYENLEYITKFNNNILDLKIKIKNIKIKIKYLNSKYYTGNDEITQLGEILTKLSLKYNLDITTTNIDNEKNIFSIRYNGSPIDCINFFESLDKVVYFLQIYNLSMQVNDKYIRGEIVISYAKNGE